MFKPIAALLLAGLLSIPCRAEFRDPTQPDIPLSANAAAGNDSGEPILSAIWITPRSRWATINGVTGKQGQTIEVERKQVLSQDPATTPDHAISDSRNTARQPVDAIQNPNAPIRLFAIKIISIRKNSVVIEQNGKRQTLQLVQRLYQHNRPIASQIK